MNPSILQRWIDEIQETSGQQWLLRLVAVAASMAATLAATGASGNWWPIGLTLVAASAIASAVRPDTHIATFVIVIIVWRWLVAIDDLSTPWLPVAGVCLLVYHSVIAISASVPIGGDLPISTLAQWVWRSALGGGATIGVWGLVVMFDQRDAAGNGLLTGIALAIAAAGAIALRSRSLAAPR